jgi:hypothetical protein
MSRDISADEAKEIYAHYGLAIYCSSVLEHGAANALLVLELFEGRGGAKTKTEWESLVDKHYEESFARTLGQLIKRLSEHHAATVSTLVPDLKNCVTKRNFLVHHFWREHALHWFTSEGRAAMAAELEEARELFSSTDKKLEAVIEPIEKQRGVTDELIRAMREAEMREALKGPR